VPLGQALEPRVDSDYESSRGHDAMAFWGRTRADLVNTRAMRAEESGHEAEAIGLYEKAAALDPRWFAPWYNLGLLHKRARRWAESIRYNAEAVRRAPKNASALWNLGIAATAVGSWAEARTAWRGIGLSVPDGDGPFDLKLGLVPIRLDPHGRGEVVWCRRIDPVRAEILNVPTPESGRRYRDIVLNDGEPVGKRVRDGIECSVFNELLVLQASSFATYRVEVETPTEDDQRALADAFEAAGMAAEDWTANIVALCKACSEGTPHDRHEAEAEAPWRRERVVGVACADEATAATALAAWAAHKSGRAVRTFERAL
jgi:hypothetical protein